MEIRRAVFDDAAALVEFNRAMAFETEGKQLDPETLRPGVEAVFGDDKKGFYIVAEKAGNVVAGLMVTYEWSDWRNGWFWWVQSVYVVPEMRGHGVYKLMYAYVKELAADARNVCGFRLYVETENKAAQAVYEKLGMRRPHYLMYEDEKTG